MANIKSKEKNIKRIEKATKRNRIVKSQVRTAIKNAKRSINEKDVNTTEKVQIAKKVINKAVSKGVLHKNNGARKASRLDSYIVKNIVS